MTDLTKKCRSCGEEVNKDAKKCKHCGADLRNWFVRHWFISTILVLVVIGVATQGSDGSEKSSFKDTPTQKTYADISCADFAGKFGIKSTLSDLQKDELIKDYKGKWAKWSGTVSSVSSTFGQLQLQVKCLPSTLTSDAIISFDDSEKDVLLKLKEGDKVNFEGQISDWGQLMPSSLSNGKVVLTN